MHELSKHNINVPNQVLQRAISMPMDNPQLAKSYPTVRSALMFNPFGTPEYKKAEAERRRAAEKLAAAAAKEAAKLANKIQRRKPPTPLPVIEEEKPIEIPMAPKVADPFAALRAIVKARADARKFELEQQLKQSQELSLSQEQPLTAGSETKVPVAASIEQKLSDLSVTTGKV